MTNSGSVNATATGGAAIALGAGGNVSNTSGGTIFGQGFGVFVTGTPGTVTNGGVIGGLHGIALEAGGTVTNGTGATIVGGVAGVFSSGGAATILNAGSISATGAAGLDIEGGGTISNLAGGSVTGSAFGVFLSGGPGTISNAGTISGASYSIKFSGSSNDRLIVDPGAVFIGAVGGGGGTTTMELAAGTGSIGGINAGSFLNFQSLAVDGAASWSLGGANAVASVTNDGQLAVNGSLDVTSAIDPGSDGVFQINAAGSLDIAAALGANTQMQFIGGGDLAIEATGSFGINVGSTSYAGPLLDSFGSWGDYRPEAVRLRRRIAGLQLHHRPPAACKLLGAGRQPEVPNRQSGGRHVPCRWRRRGRYVHHA